MVMCGLTPHIVFDKIQKQLLKIIGQMIKEDQIDGVVLGCTELPLILSAEDLTVATLDIAKIHIETIVSKINI